MESWKAWCINAGLEREIVPGGLCINDSNLVLEAVRLGKGIALERRSLVQDALSRGELVQLTSFTAPYPWPYWLVSSQGAEQKTKPFYLRPGLMGRLPRGASKLARWRRNVRETVNLSSHRKGGRIYSRMLLID